MPVKKSSFQRQHIKPDLSLYVIIDSDYLTTLKRGPHKTLVSALKGGATAVQLRSKNLNDRDYYNEAKKMFKTASKFSALFFVNDRVHIAAALRCGFHTGFEDMPFSEARKLVKPPIAAGLSASTVREALAADMLKPTYIGLGPVFPTSTKDKKNISLSSVKKIIVSSSSPIVAIGGIKEYNINQLIKIGVKNFCFISEICGAGNVYEKTRAIKKIIQGA